MKPIVAPSASAAIAPMITEAITAAEPSAKNQGNRGKMAPTENDRNELMAARQASPGPAGRRPVRGGHGYRGRYRDWRRGSGQRYWRLLPTGPERGTCQPAPASPLRDPRRAPGARPAPPFRPSPA